METGELALIIMNPGQPETWAQPCVQLRENWRNQVGTKVSQQTRLHQERSSAAGKPTASCPSPLAGVWHQALPDLSVPPWMQQQWGLKLLKLPLPQWVCHQQNCSHRPCVCPLATHWTWLQQPILFRAELVNYSHCCFYFLSYWFSPCTSLSLAPSTFTADSSLLQPFEHPRSQLSELLYLNDLNGLLWFLLFSGI